MGETRSGYFIKSTQAGHAKHGPSARGRAMERRIEGSSDPKYVSTSNTKRRNLTMQMLMRRSTQLTNACSKTFENDMHMDRLYIVWYNFIRIRQSPRHSRNGRRFERGCLGHGRSGADAG